VCEIKFVQLILLLFLIASVKRGPLESILIQHHQNRTTIIYIIIRHHRLISLFLYKEILISPLLTPTCLKFNPCQKENEYLCNSALISPEVLFQVS
jgi:hypothetical protein